MSTARTTTKHGTASTPPAGSKPLPPTHFEAKCAAEPGVVYALLADLGRHLEWAGESQSPTTRLLTMDAPSGPAMVGTEFRTTGSDGKVAVWRDRSVVTEATPDSVFEFVTEGVRQGKPGHRPMEATTVHRYEILPAPDGCTVTYEGRVTRTVGFPRIVHMPLVGAWLLGYAAKAMRRGFDGLIAAAAEATERPAA